MKSAPLSPTTLTSPSIPILHSCAAAWKAYLQEVMIRRNDAAPPMLRLFLMIISTSWYCCTAFLILPSPSSLSSLPSASLLVERRLSTASTSVCVWSGRKTRTRHAASNDDGEDSPKRGFLPNLFGGSKGSKRDSKSGLPSKRLSSSSRASTPTPPTKKSFVWPSPSSSSSSPSPQVRPASSRFTKNSNEDLAEEEPSSSTPSSFFSDLTQRLQTPLPLGPIFQKFVFFSIGFLGGGASGLLVLLSPSSPLTSLPPSLLQPITLFENILLEIDRGYVEEVDSSKLFEAAVESMLATLDPYTEYEGQQLAQDMREVRS